METLPIALVGLALLDSTSFGTLLIPVWLLVTPGRIRAGRIITYLGTVTTFYFCVGILPYLAAVALIDSADMGWPLTAATLAGYCVVMTIPALLLVGARFTAHRRLDPLLQRLDDWFTRNRDKVLGWTIGGIGIGVALNAILELTVG
jgi:hypothetical protein